MYMTLADYILLNNFTADEVVKAGGNPDKMQKSQMVKVQNLRSAIDRRMHFCYNGLNSGNHTAEEHGEGLATDFILDTRDGPINQATINNVFRCALDVGFTGIGIYFNGVCWSFHIDQRPKFTTWVGRKPSPQSHGWTIRNMLIGAPAN